METEDDSQPVTSINETEKFKPINRIKWSKEFEDYVASYKTARKSLVLLLYVICNNSKRPDVAAMALLPQTEQEYWNLNLDHRNRRYVKDSK